MIKIVNKASKFRIYPTEEQKALFVRYFGSIRFIYSYLLNARRDAYRKENKKISGFECKRMISSLKKREEYKWLKEVNFQSLQEAALNLHRAYNRFFKKINNAKYPNCKKKQHKQSFCIPQHFQIDTKKGFDLYSKTQNSDYPPISSRVWRYKRS